MLLGGSAELRVGLCGHSARVALGPEEGVGRLRARVADAFGLTAPFDLVGPEGAPIRSDEDAARALAEGGQPMFTVDAGEEALLDLERAHEASGAMCWTLVREIIAGLRRQVAEVAASGAESQRRVAVLNEQLARERAQRESADAAVRADIRNSADILETELGRWRAETRAALEAAVADVKQCIDTSAKLQSEALAAEVTTLRQ